MNFNDASLGPTPFKISLAYKKPATDSQVKMEAVNSVLYLMANRALNRPLNVLVDNFQDLNTYVRNFISFNVVKDIMPEVKYPTALLQGEVLTKLFESKELEIAEKPDGVLELPLIRSFEDTSYSSVERFYKGHACSFITLLQALSTEYGMYSENIISRFPKSKAKSFISDKAYPYTPVPGADEKSIFLMVPEGLIEVCKRHYPQVVSEVSLDAIREKVLKAPVPVRETPVELPW